MTSSDVLASASIAGVTATVAPAVVASDIHPRPEPAPAFSCAIAGVPCVLGFHDEHVLRYYRNYHPRVLPEGMPSTGDVRAGVTVNGVAVTARIADGRVVVPYCAEPVRHLVDITPGADEAFGEWQISYDPVSRAMLRFDRLTFHGACIEYGGRAYIFTATSGTGKSTHIRLWRRYLGADVGIVNGDKPIIDLSGPSDIAACGSPWCGKEGWQRNVRVPLAGIVILRRATASDAGPDETAGIAGPAVDAVAPASSRNSIRRATTTEAIDELINRIYLTDDPDEAAMATGLLDRLITHVPVYVLTCDMSEDAVRTSFEGITGLPYPPDRCVTRAGVE